MVTTGEPIKISACHCTACQKRTGSAFSVAVFFQVEHTRQEGASAVFSRVGDSGLAVAYHFCLACASTVFWYPEFRPGWIGVAIGCFDDRTLLPTQAVYDGNRLEWVHISLAAPGR